MSIVLKCYLWQCITWGYLWEAILSQSIYCCRADIQPNVDYVAFLLQDNLLQLSCYVAIDWQTKRREYVTDTSIPLIATDIGYVTDIFIPRSKMFLAFLYHETICYWHVHTTDIVLLTVYYWQCITDSVLLTLYYWQCITDSMSIQLRDGLLRFLYHRAICDTRCITICWRYVVKGYFLSILITKSRWLTHFWVCISHQNQDQNLRLLLL